MGPRGGRGQGRPRAGVGPLGRALDGKAPGCGTDNGALAHVSHASSGAPSTELTWCFGRPTTKGSPKLSDGASLEVRRTFSAAGDNGRDRWQERFVGGYPREGGQGFGLVKKRALAGNLCRGPAVRGWSMAQWRTWRGSASATAHKLPRICTADTTRSCSYSRRRGAINATPGRVGELGWVGSGRGGIIRCTERIVSCTGCVPLRNALVPLGIVRTHRFRPPVPPLARLEHACIGRQVGEGIRSPLPKGCTKNGPNQILLQVSFLTPPPPCFLWSSGGSVLSGGGTGGGGGRRLDGLLSGHPSPNEHIIWGKWEHNVGHSSPNENTIWGMTIWGIPVEMALVCKWEHNLGHPSAKGNNFWGKAGGAYRPLDTYPCPSLQPFPSIGLSPPCGALPIWPILTSLHTIPLPWEGVPPGTRGGGSRGREWPV